MDLIYRIKLWIGFKFLGWHKPKDYDYGYFMDRTCVLMKKRINVIPGKKWRTINLLKVCPKEGIDWTKL